MKKWLGKMFLGLLVVVGFLLIGGYLYLQLPKFGQQPKGAALERISQSPNYVNGSFQNLAPVPAITNNGGMVSALMKYLFAKKDRSVPPTPIPAMKTDLLALDKNEDVVIWLGHSSYYVQLNGKRLLIDPVFSDNASPVPLTNLAFDNTNQYTANDMPDIDYLLISHDHWDHLDYPTIKALKDKVGQVMTGLGVGEHFKRWGYDESIILEGDWNNAFQLDDSLAIHLLPSRHYSGRMFTRNQTLWVAFALITPVRKIFFSGDSGYGPHFTEIGKRFESFDLVILDSGQYNENWRYIHMTPEEASQAAEDLRADAVLPAHIGKFSLAYHAWDEPLIRWATFSEDKDYRLLTPVIGEPVLLKEEQVFRQWWK